MQATSPDNILEAGYFPYIIPLMSKEVLNRTSLSEFRTLFFKVTSTSKTEFKLQNEERERLFSFLLPSCSAAAYIQVKGADKLPQKEEENENIEKAQGGKQNEYQYDGTEPQYDGAEPG